ncbi:MAG: hypothetical protein AAGB22_09125, partial [Bacteroidota bacterium]
QDRTPYDGNFRTVLSYDYDEDTYIYQETYYTAEVEQYYLNSIQTRSHTALFIKNVREDARGHYDPTDPADKPASSMVLEEILLFDNATFNNIPLNLSNTANENTELAGEASYNALLDRYDWPAAYDQTYRPIQRIAFNHDYHLVPNTASSFPNAATPPTTTSYGSGGKLSLNALDIKAKDGTAAGSLEGEYQFFYSGNTNYAVDRWDGWGIPYPGGNGQGSIYVFDMAHIAPWAMNRVIDPMGAEVSVDYERDMYCNVAGNAVKDEPGNILTQRVGGGFRVRMLTTTDPQTGEQYKNRYVYTQDGSENGVSSGALAMEPLGRWHDYPIYASYDWKESPVMYAMTDVLTGYTSSTDYLERIQYQHIVPHQNMVLTEQAVDPDITYNFNHGSSTPQVIFKKANYRIHVKTSQIGNPRFVKRFSPKGHLLYQQEFRYQNQGLLDVSDPGMYSEGSILSQIALDGGDYKYYQKLFRTTKLHYPFRLESVTTMENEMSESLTYRAFDPISGMPTEIDVKDELGTTYREKLVPAYTKLPYAGMGSKVVNSANANLLGDIAERHRFYVFPNGQEALVDVEVNTFQLGGNYRSLSGGSYTTVNQSDVWR